MYLSYSHFVQEGSSQPPARNRNFCPLLRMQTACTSIDMKDSQAGRAVSLSQTQINRHLDIESQIAECTRIPNGVGVGEAVILREDVKRSLVFVHLRRCNSFYQYHVPIFPIVLVHADSGLGSMRHLPDDTRSRN